MEFDTPDVLLSDPGSQFTSLVEQTGAAEGEHLRMLASAGARELKSTDERLVDYQLEDLRLESEENDPLITRNNLF